MKKNKVLEYIADRKYYLSLLGGLLVILVAVGVIYNNGRQYEEIANLNEAIQKEGLVDNPIEEQTQVIVDNSAVVPQITIHDEEVVPDDVPLDTAVVSDDLIEAVATNDIEEGELEAFVPVIKVQQPNLSFTVEEGMMMPLQGDVIIPYSDAVPAYFKTLNQYQINKGLYIANEVGSEVKAVADGVVEKIELGKNHGNCITIYHGNGYMSFYGQLQEDMNVKEGDLVERGSIIGYLNEPSKFYTLEGTHLYFEVLENDKPINPISLIK
ncbi:MAG: hypothetical protein CVU84_07935 [Firmicutes bacterium HGW-Firmicutes-1]|jgi:murein DD-endopeptidase MepM/ murein hydrolase activator NlpD|nr:MAG: hypothetical protein CVU84_07935 [Firmicutes bacterium HGW-Firmicutes-1]